MPVLGSEIMIRGLYIAATGMIAQRNRMDNITNNLANAETAGYKKDIMVTRTFDDVLIERLNDPSIISAVSEVGPINYGTHIDQVRTVFTEGPLDGTDRSEDLAITGNGFFSIETPEGERYTRDGSFFVSSEGYLSTGDGQLVLGMNGPIQVGFSGFSVDAAGNIFAGGGFAGRLKIVQFQDLNTLRKQGGNLYINLGQAPVQATDYNVIQSYLESSNIDIGRETVDMIEVYRNYETNQRMMRMIDGTLEKTVNELGRV